MFVNLPARPHAIGLLAALALAPGSATGDARTPADARAGLSLVQSAASAWAEDAILIYVENDEPLDASGGSGRWGYLFHSPAMDRSRAYSVGEGKILLAEDFGMALDAPPIAPGWIDSREAIRIAEEKEGNAFRLAEQGDLASMVLTRGIFDDGDPDRTTWTVVYRAPARPALFVVIDARTGKVRRTFRG